MNGGNDEFIPTFFKHLKYPAEARELGVEGTVVGTYVITVEGTVIEIEIIEDPGTGLGDSVANALSYTTEGVSFKPAEIQGGPVNVKKQIEVKFKLEG